jgi:hypothetical protein
MSSASRDNADWGLTVERAACERWKLDHIANDPDAPDWFDARATEFAAHEQNRAAVASRHAPDDRSQRGGSG